MKVVILGGYHPTQSVGAVYRAFVRAGHEVWHVPTMPEFLPEQMPDNVDLLFSFKIGLGAVPRGLIQNLKIPYKVFWSFDDPHWVRTRPDELHWAKEHDITLTSCAESKMLYAMKQIQAHFLPPAMDVHTYSPTTHAPERHLASFICTTLYPPSQFPHQKLDRSKMVDRLTATFGKDFALYGYNKEVEEKEAWRGPVDWATTLPDAIRATRMNINSHVETNSFMYMNERFFQIVSLKRAMFCDRVIGLPGIFGADDDCIIWYSSLDELVEKLIFYKAKEERLVELGYLAYARMRGWTYDEFVKQVMVAIDGGEPKPAFMQ